MAIKALSRLKKEDFEKQVFDFIRFYEGDGPKFYVNLPDVHPTIGHGFNIDAFSYNEIVSGFNFILKGFSSDQRAGLELIRLYKSGQKIDIAGKPVSFDYKIFKDIIEGRAGTQAQQRALNSFNLTSQQQDDLLKEVLFNNNKVFSRSFDEGLTKTLGASSAVEASQERVALLSLYYNLNSLVGQGVRTAIANDQRSALWYEVRYDHKDQINPRRFAESDKIDIVALKHTIDDVVSNLNYLFNGKNLKGKSVYENIIAKDHSFTFEKGKGIPLEKQFVAKVAPLLKEVAKEYSYDDTLHFLQSDSNQVGRLQSKDAYDQAGHRLAISNNALFGLEGSDTLSGGKGHDLLVGGSGADVMTGGAGDDVYVVDDQGDKVVEGASAGTDKVVLQAAGVFDFRNVEALILKSALKAPVEVNLNEIASIQLTDSDDRLTVNINKIQDLPISVKTGNGKDIIKIVPTRGVDPSQVSNGVGKTEHFNFQDFSKQDHIDLTSFHIKSIVSASIHSTVESGYYLVAPGASITIDSQFPKYSKYNNNSSDWWIAQLGNDTPWGPSMHGDLSAASFIV